MPEFDQLVKIIQHADITLPAVEFCLLLVILALCMVLHYTKVGLIAAYVFAYRWGWTFFSDQNEQKYMVWYLVFGLLVGVLTVIGMLRTRPSS